MIVKQGLGHCTCNGITKSDSGCMLVFMRVNLLGLRSTMAGVSGNALSSTLVIEVLVYCTE